MVGCAVNVEEKMKHPYHPRQTITHTAWEDAQIDADRSERARARREIWLKHKQSLAPEALKRIEAFDTKHGIKKDRGDDPKMTMIRRHSGRSKKKVTLPKL